MPRNNGVPHLLYFNADTNAVCDDQGQVFTTLDFSGVTTLTLPTGAVTATQLASSAVTQAKIAVPKVTIYQETVTFSQFTDGGSTAGTLSLSTSIPAGAVFLNSAIHAITGFAGDTSAALTIGDGTDVDRYNTGTMDVFTTAAAGVSCGAPSGTAFHSAAKTPVLTITSGSDFTAVSAGAVTVTLVYIQPV